MLMTIQIKISMFSVGKKNSFATNSHGYLSKSRLAIFVNLILRQSQFALKAHAMEKNSKDTQVNECIVN